MHFSTSSRVSHKKRNSLCHGLAIRADSAAQGIYVSMRCDLLSERKLLCTRGLRSLLVPRRELRHFARSFRRSEVSPAEMSFSKTKRRRPGRPFPCRHANLRTLDLAQPAVDVDLFPRDIRRILRGQKRNHAGNFFRLSEAFH